MWNAGNVRLRLVTPIGVGHGPRAKKKKVRKFWAADTTTAVQDPEDPEKTLRVADYCRKGRDWLPVVIR